MQLFSFFFSFFCLFVWRCQKVARPRYNLQNRSTGQKGSVTVSERRHLANRNREEIRYSIERTAIMLAKELYTILSHRSVRTCRARTHVSLPARSNELNFDTRLPFKISLSLSRVLLPALFPYSCFLFFAIVPQTQKEKTAVKPQSLCSFLFYLRELTFLPPYFLAHYVSPYVAKPLLKMRIIREQGPFFSFFF